MHLIPASANARSKTGRFAIGLFQARPTALDLNSTVRCLDEASGEAKKQRGRRDAEGRVIGTLPVAG